MAYPVGGFVFGLLLGVIRQYQAHTLTLGSVFSLTAVSSILAYAFVFAVGLWLAHAAIALRREPKDEG